jgi:hypothetical protein
MLALLLDEQISTTIAVKLRRKQPQISIVGLSEWHEGKLLGLSDDRLLEAAAVEKLTLVTYDMRTIPPLLKTWAESGRSHGGIIFVAANAIRPCDFGGLIRALEMLYRSHFNEDWTDRIIFLGRAVAGATML